MALMAVVQDIRIGNLDYFVRKQSKMSCLIIVTLHLKYRNIKYSFF